MATEWIQTSENRALFPRAIKPEQVGSIEEIAHALSQNFRFTRQLATPYSVAEHCVRGARLMPKAFAGAFLLHELSEVYLPDIPAPLKPHVLVTVERPSDQMVCSECGTGDRADCGRCGGTVAAGGVLIARPLISWADLEREHTHVMLQALGLSSIEPLIYSPEVRAMDLAMLAAEKKWLVGPEPMPWGLDVEPPRFYKENAICPMTVADAREDFVGMFGTLFR